MCGLVGIYSSNMMPRHKDALADMLYLDTWRGKDSTGVAAIRSNADTAIYKSTVPGYEFVEGPKLGEHLKLNDFCWIGHNRYGTVGRNIKTNAHPFSIDDEEGACMIVGAHNGTLRNKHVLMEHVRFGTDSEALYNNIAHEGLEKSIEKIEGAWALTYYDHYEEELRILRNKERTLFYAFEEGKKTLIWASEMWMIRVACSRNDIKLQGDNVFSFAEDTLYRFPAPMKMNEEISMERKGGVVGKQTPAFFQSRNKVAGVGGTTTTNTSTTTTPAARAQLQEPTSLTSNTPSSTITQNSGEKLSATNVSSSVGTSSDKSDDKVRDILSAKKYKGYAGVLLTRKELDDQLENGCGWCELEFVVAEDRFAWLAPGKPICHKCLTGQEEPEQSLKKISTH